MGNRVASFHVFFFTVTVELSTVRFMWYYVERLVPPAHVSNKLPRIHCVGETTSSVRKINGKGVGKNYFWMFNLYVLFVV